MYFNIKVRGEGYIFGRRKPSKYRAKVDLDITDTTITINKIQPEDPEARLFLRDLLPLEVSRDKEYISGYFKAGDLTALVTGSLNGKIEGKIRLLPRLHLCSKTGSITVYFEQE